MSYPSQPPNNTVRDSALLNIAQQLGRIAAQGGLATTYATGTWTPGLVFGGSATGISMATQNGTWTQIGRIFFCFFRLQIATLTSVSGVTLLTGLPAMSSGDQAQRGAGGVVTNALSMSSLTSLPIIQVGSLASVASVFQYGASGVVAVSAGNFTNTSVLAGTFQFYI